jgi:hypothetical protein
MLLVVVTAVLAFTSCSGVAQTIVTFDDLNETGSGSFLSSPYQGLVWSNFSCNNAILDTGILARIQGSSITSNGLTGDYYGLVSPSNVAGAASAEVDSTLTNFNFLSVYLTGFLSSNLSIEVEGYEGSMLLYDSTVIASATNPTLFTFNYMNIDRLSFNGLGGQPAFGIDNSSSNVWIMDNFTFEFVPEPSTFLLVTVGGVSLVVLLRRRRQRQGLLS